MRGNLTSSELGHLVPLTVGHRDSPIDSEVKYIKQIWRLANFLKNDDESLESAGNLCGSPPDAPRRPPGLVDDPKVEHQHHGSEPNPEQAASSNRG